MQKKLEALKKKADRKRGLIPPDDQASEKRKPHKRCWLTNWLKKLLF